MRLFSAVLLVTMLLANALVAQTAGGFKKFETDPNTPKGAHAVVKDPTGTAPLDRVHRFTLNPGACSDRKHVSANSSDCKFQSMRATAYEPDFKLKTDEWVAWSLYLPSDFPVGKQQAASGLYTFAYWHNSLCPNVALVADTGNSTTLYVQTNKADPSGKWNCLPDQRFPIADLRALRGKWHRFELHTVFRPDNSGQVEVYLDGSKVLSRNLSTIAPGPKKNYFVFGLYLCCTKGTDLITPATVYYTNLSRGRTREAVD